MAYIGVDGAQLESCEPIWIISMNFVCYLWPNYCQVLS